MIYRRLRAVVASVAVLGIALSGCTLFDEAPDDSAVVGLNAPQFRALDDTLRKLALIEGVISVSAESTPDDEWGSELEFGVIVEETIADERVAVIAAALRGSLHNPEFARVPATLSLSVVGDSAATLVLRGFDLESDAVANNFSYWRAIQKAIGAELRMELVSFPDSGLAYLRYFEVPSGADSRETLDHFIDNFDALTAVRDVGDDERIDGERAHTGWVLPGLQSMGGLPPADVVNLIDDIRAILPLVYDTSASELPVPGIDSFDGVSVWWSPSSGPQSGAQVSVRQSKPDDESWRAVLEIATRSSEIEGLSFRYLTANQSQSLHTSTCDGRVDSSRLDEELFDAVVANGASFPVGAGAGSCNPEF